MNTTSLSFWDLEPYRSPTSIIIIKGNLVWIVFYNLIDTKKDGRIINDCWQIEPIGYSMSFVLDSLHYILYTALTKPNKVLFHRSCKLFHHLHSYLCFTCTFFIISLSILNENITM